MNKKSNKPECPGITRGDFIAFLSSATPEEINNVIAEQGKPAKKIDPLIRYGKRETKQGGN